MNALAPLATQFKSRSQEVWPELRLFEGQQKTRDLSWGKGLRAIEDDDFPFEILSEVAELESWRKEINRPIYHIHKWWAQRLGTVFRAITLGAFAPAGSDLMELFYQPVRIKEAVVFDPFMGSGTTIGEALKMGARAVGRDINPVAHFLVRNALAFHDREAILKTFDEIEHDVADQIRYFYRSKLPSGEIAEVLYFFWVKQLDCPSCLHSVDLFSSRIFAKHAYPKRCPASQALCPHCDAINEVAYDATLSQCTDCHKSYDPQKGTARGQNAHCPHCEHVFPIGKTFKKQSVPPQHRLYAKLVLLSDGSKTYLKATEEDRALYIEAAQCLESRPQAYPVVQIEAGYNTNQAIGYNYNYWHEMFNSRQLLCLSILSDRIKRIENAAVRDLFTCLLSGSLEFNNMFASYKGEGTGAVRNMFSHHILKPEKTPLEANVWGTSKSSGAFSTIFRGRIRRALEYAHNPFELRVIEKNGRKTGEKIYDLSVPLDFSIADKFSGLGKGKQVYLSCGDSSTTDLPSRSVDAVITDPPFFDNVHYSQLADFFHVWQRHVLGQNGHHELSSTRSLAEVQHQEVTTFTDRLSSVFKETHRVLKSEGLLCFTYHHSRPEGWHSILDAIMRSGFQISAVQPIKSEMSGALPKHQAKEPINLDIIIVCRKREKIVLQNGIFEWSADCTKNVVSSAQSQVNRFQSVKRCLSLNDIRVIVMAQLIKQLSSAPKFEHALRAIDQNSSEIEFQIKQIHKNHHV